MQLSWDELAALYDKHHGGRRARTLPMEYIAQWAEGRTDLFKVDEEDCFVLVEKGGLNELP